MAKANVEVDKAAVLQAQAQLNSADVSLGYTKITSPVKGTIVARRVDIGQTVVATFSAQSLFLIAKDLTRLQVWASINEADIGRIHLGMPVTFQVEAFPDDTFHGTVGQIRLNAQSNQNVVTYTVVVDTDNSDMKLLPYLTTDPVKFEVERHTGVLLVPNAALRWQPRPEQIAPDVREGEKSAESDKDGQEEKPAAPPEAEKSDSNAGKAAAGETKADGKGEGSGKGERGHRAKSRGEHGTLWVKDGNYVRPIEVRKGASDDQDSEVSGDGLEDGMQVVIGEVHAADQMADETNPFAPRFFRGRKGGSAASGKGAK